MGLVIQIGLLVLVLASFVVAYFSSKAWHWGHVVIVLGVFLSAVLFLFLSAETLRINAVFRSKANRLQEDLNETLPKIAALKEGTDDMRLINRLAAEEVTVPEDAEEIPSIVELDHRLHLETRLRGRVWRGMNLVSVDPATGVTTVAAGEGAATGVASDTVVFAFEQGDPSLPDSTQGAQYMGEFRVSDVVGQQVTLVPVLELDEFELKRLDASSKPWALYETMPVDRYSLFAELSEEGLQGLIPAASFEEYLRHGTPAGPDDEPWLRYGLDDEGNILGPDQLDESESVLHRRRLRDYGLEFEQLSHDHVLVLTKIDLVRADVEKLQATLESARKLQAFREDELQRLQRDFAGVSRDRESIEQHLALVQRQLAAAKDVLTAALEKNIQLTRQLVALQTQLRNAIDQQSAADVSIRPLALGAMN